MSFGDLLSNLGSQFGAAGQGLGNALYPNDPNVAAYTDPNQAAAARNNGLISLGLGIMAAPYNRMGMGAGLLNAYQGSQQGYQQAMDSAFKNTLLRREADYQHDERALQLKQQQRTEREQASQTAQRVLMGLNSAQDPSAYLSLVQNTPEFKDALGSLNIQPPYTGPMANPTNLQTFRDQLGAAAQVGAPAVQPIKLSAGDVLLDPTTKQPVASAAPKATVEWKDAGDKLVPKNSVTGADVPGLAPIPKSQTPYQTARLNISSGNLADWTPEALDFAAEKLYRTGVAPANLGKGSPVLAQLYSMAADKAKAEGKDNTAAVYGQQAFKAGGQALGALTKQQNIIGAYEQTASKNMDLALQLSENVDRTGSPLINKGIMAWKHGVTGDAETAGFVNALTAARTEYAKVLSGATGATGVTDSARKEADELFSKVTSKETLRYVMGVAKQEMQNRMSSFTEQQARLRDSMTGRTGAPAAAAPAGTPGAGWSITPVAVGQ